jgi:hypothetical protein
MNELHSPHDSEDPDLLDEIDDDDPDPIEAYCVRCRDKVEMEQPQPVWTSRGQAATRGICPDCGTLIFRIGRTDAHRTMQAPPPVRVEDVEKTVPNRGRKKYMPATFINIADRDQAMGVQLAKDLAQAGLHTWYDPESLGEAVQWAGGLHPALRDCVKMVVVISAGITESVRWKAAWEFFKKERRPLVVATLGDGDQLEIPDALRRLPRYDLSKDYKAALRGIMESLG